MLCDFNGNLYKNIFILNTLQFNDLRLDFTTAKFSKIMLQDRSDRSLVTLTEVMTQSWDWCYGGSSMVIFPALTFITG